MGKTLQQSINHIKSKYFNLHSLVIIVAILVSASWVLGALEVMQRNYSLQKNLDDKKRQLLVTELDTANVELAQRYYKTDEYKELAARDKLGLAFKDEKVLILPKNSEAIKKADADNNSSSQIDSVQASNFEQWMNFLFGKNSGRLSE